MSDYKLHLYTMHNESNMSVRVYNIIRDNIVFWDLKPGTAMSENAVSQQLGVSRTPVREAFIRLRNEGLVDVTPQRGTSVSLLDLKRIEEERFLRSALEIALLSHIPIKLPPNALEAMRCNLELQEAAVSENNVKDLLRLDDEFHNSIFVLCENPLSWHIISENCSHYKRIRYFSLCSSDRCRTVYDQHVEMYLSLKNGRTDKLKNLYNTHLGSLSTEEMEMKEKNSEYFY